MKNGSKEFDFKNDMKNLYRLSVVAVSLLILASCSKKAEELVPKEPNTQDILVEESPWVFSSYDISVVEDDGGSGLSNQEIEDDMNQYITDVQFTFKSDGTGFIDFPNQGREDWVWTLGEDVLLTFSDTDNDSYTFFSADRNQMTFESRTTTIHTKDSISYNVRHVGKYFFN